MPRYMNVNIMHKRHHKRDNKIHVPRFASLGVSVERNMFQRAANQVGKQAKTKCTQVTEISFANEAVFKRVSNDFQSEQVIIQRAIID